VQSAHTPPSTPQALVVFPWLQLPCEQQPPLQGVWPAPPQLGLQVLVVVSQAWGTKKP
jgi:hypothetical protein